MQVTTVASGLVPYIAGAAVAAFALDYCVQSFGTSLNASDRVGIQSETVQPLNLVDRSHKGDRLSAGQKANGQAASGNVTIGDMEPPPARAPLNDAPRPPRLLPDLPDGCESAFSPLSAAEQKKLATRCST
jgi:hypothetical protein